MTQQALMVIVKKILIQPRNMLKLVFIKCYWVILSFSIMFVFIEIYKFYFTVIVIIIISDQLKHIRTDISDIKSDVNKMKIDIDTLKNALTKNKIIGAKDFVGTVQQLGNKFQFKIPFENVKEFEDFNIKLQQDEALHEAVVRQQFQTKI